MAELVDRQIVTLRASPNDAEQYARLGLTYEANNYWVEASECFERAQELQPDEPMWVHHVAMAEHRLGNVEEALRCLDTAANRFPDFVPIMYRYGDLLLQTGNIARAEVVFRRVVKLAPGHCVGYVGLGEAMLQSGAWEDAVANLERAVQLCPDYKTARYLLGTAYRRFGDEERAAYQLKLGMGASKRYPDDAWGAQRFQYELNLLGLLKRADSLLDAGSLEAAIANLERLQQARHDDTRVMNKLAAAYLQAERYEKALPLLLGTLAIAPDDLSSHVNLAHCYLGLGRLDDALASADRAIALAPDLWNAHLQRGQVLIRLERNDEAYLALQRAVESHPDTPLVYDLLGNVSLKLQRFEVARDHYTELIQRYPNQVAGYVGLSKALVKLKHFAEASSALDQARRIAPNDSAVLELANLLDSVRTED